MSNIENTSDFDLDKEIPYKSFTMDILGIPFTYKITIIERTGRKAIRVRLVSGDEQADKLCDVLEKEFIERVFQELGKRSTAGITEINESLSVDIVPSELVFDAESAGVKI